MVGVGYGWVGAGDVGGKKMKKINKLGAGTVETGNRQHGNRTMSFPMDP